MAYFLTGTPELIRVTNVSTDRATIEIVPRANRGHVQIPPHAIFQQAPIHTANARPPFNRLDVNSMDVSRPGSPSVDPPARLTDQAAVSGFLRARAVEEYVEETLTNINARIDAQVQAENEARALERPSNRPPPPYTERGAGPSNAVPGPSNAAPGPSHLSSATAGINAARTARRNERLAASAPTASANNHTARRRRATGPVNPDDVIVLDH